LNPVWFENDWGARQRQQGDANQSISREELGFEGQSIEYCGLMSARQILKREPEWDWKPEGRNRKSAKVASSMTGPTLADHIEKSTFSEDCRVFAIRSSGNRNAGLSRASAPIAPRSHELCAGTTERHQSHAGQPPANRVRRLRQDGSRWPGAWPRPQRGPTSPTRSSTIGRSRDRFRLVEIFQTRLAKLTGDAKMLIWNR